VATVTIIDYGMGNLRSIQKGLEKAGAETMLSSDIEEIKDASALVLPGVGAFEEAIKRLESGGFSTVIRDKVDQGTPLLGVCLGMQLLFESSTEGGFFGGLKILPGAVDRFPSDLGIKIPHMGWNELVFKQPDHFLLQNIPEGSYVYFVHSYHPITDEAHIIATTVYGLEFACIVKNDAGNVVATQFHPEKSSDTGIAMLENFVNFCKN